MIAAAAIITQGKACPSGAGLSFLGGRGDASGLRW